MYSGRRIFRAGFGFVILFAGITAMLAYGAAFMYRERGWDWVSIGLAAAAIFLGLGSVLESLVQRIELTDDALVVTDLRGRRRYHIADIARVAEAKGAPASIQLANGRWVKLPMIGSNVGNSVRAWLKESTSR